MRTAAETGTCSYAKTARSTAVISLFDNVLQQHGTVSVIFTSNTGGTYRMSFTGGGYARGSWVFLS